MDSKFESRPRRPLDAAVDVEDEVAATVVVEDDATVTRFGSAAAALAMASPMVTGGDVRRGGQGPRHGLPTFLRWFKGSCSPWPGDSTAHGAGASVSRWAPPVISSSPHSVWLNTGYHGWDDQGSRARRGPRRPAELRSYEAATAGVAVHAGGRDGRAGEIPRVCGCAAARVRAGGEARCLASG